MKEILLHTEDRENSDAMFKEVGGREARESHLSQVEAKKSSHGRIWQEGGYRTTHLTPRR